MSCRVMPAARHRRLRTVRAAAVVAIVSVAAACGCSQGIAPPGAHGGRPAAAALPGSSAPAGPGAAAPAVPRVVVSRVRTADGTVVTVAIFQGPVQYVLHNGSRDPGHRYAGLLHVGPVITGAERRRLLTAFNGGFLLSSHSGGYEQEGHVIRGLRRGLGSLVIDPFPPTPVAAPGADARPRRARLPPAADRRSTADHQRPPRHYGALVALGRRHHPPRVRRRPQRRPPTRRGSSPARREYRDYPRRSAAALARLGPWTGRNLTFTPNGWQFDTAPTPGGPLTAAIPRRFARPASTSPAGPGTSSPFSSRRRSRSGATLAAA